MTSPSERRETRRSSTGRNGGPQEGAWSVWLQEVAPRVDQAMEDALPAVVRKPQSIHRAMRYSVFPGGKRVRPALAALAYDLSGGRGDAGIRLGAAIEFIHTFSLIHDDLPCMDDDDYRRGRLSCHRKFGEAVAVLAGDALQVLAFEVLAQIPVAPERKVRVIREITSAVGTAGVIGGQVVDIESEGKRISSASLRWMHERKTGALIRCTLVSGGLLAGARAPWLKKLERFGVAFGLLFQIVDDLLGELGTNETLGRRRGRDRVLGKATYPAILGFARSRECLQDSIEESLAAIPADGGKGEIFVDLIGMVVGRLPGAWLEGREVSVRGK